MRTLIGGAALVAMRSSIGYTGAKPGGEPDAQTTETPLLVQFDKRNRYGAFVHITNVGVVDIEIESIRINDRTDCSYPRAPDNVNEDILGITEFLNKHALRTLKVGDVASVLIGPCQTFDRATITTDKGTLTFGDR
jgi:hypothetical protein